MKDKLSPTQIRTLRLLRDRGGWQSAYALGVGLNTLRSLYYRRGPNSYIDRDGTRAGSAFTPRTTIRWRINQNGLLYLAEYDKEKK